MPAGLPVEQQLRGSVYEIFDFSQDSFVRNLRSIKNKQLFSYFLQRRRIDLIKQQASKTRKLLIKKEEEEQQFQLNWPNFLETCARMLMFRSAEIENETK